MCRIDTTVDRVRSTTVLQYIYSTIDYCKTIYLYCYAIVILLITKMRILVAQIGKLLTLALKLFVKEGTGKITEFCKQICSVQNNGSVHCTAPHNNYHGTIMYIVQ